MSLTLDAVENNGRSASLRSRAREGDFGDLCILTWHGGKRWPWKLWTRGAADWMCTSPPSLLVFDSRNPAPAEAHSPLRMYDPRASRVGRVLAGVGCRARGHGIHGGLWEAGVEHSRRPLSNPAGQRTAY